MYSMTGMYSIADAQSISDALPQLLTYSHLSRRLIIPCTQSRCVCIMICSACGRSFSVVGYTQHIYSTSHIACTKAYKRDVELANGKERSFQLANSEPNTFAGDLSGEYDDDDDEGMSSL